MYPERFEVPALGWSLGVADVVVNLAVVLAAIFGVVLAERSAGVPRRQAIVIMLLLALCAFAGGRLHFVLNQPDGFRYDWTRALVFWRGGVHMPGGVLMVFLMAPLVCRPFGVSAARLGDAITPAVGSAIVMSRLGCVLRGCCVGDPCNDWWCIAFRPGSASHQWHVMQGLLPPDAPASLPVLPLHLGFIAMGLLIAIGAWLLRRRKRYDGQVALLALVVYAVSSAMLEPYRMHVPGVGEWGPIPQLVWATRALAIFSVTMLAIAELAHRWLRRAAPSRAPA